MTPWKETGVDQWDIEGEFTLLRLTQDKFMQGRDSYTAHQRNQEVSKINASLFFIVRPAGRIFKGVGEGVGSKTAWQIDEKEIGM